jgi:hypothetical protein
MEKREIKGREYSLRPKMNLVYLDELGLRLKTIVPNIYVKYLFR